MMLLGFFAGAYVHASDPPAASLPPPLARPLLALCPGGLDARRFWRMRASICTTGGGSIRRARSPLKTW